MLFVSFIIQAFRQKLRRGGSTSNSSVSYLQVSEANNRFALTTTFAQWASYNKYSGYRQLCLQGTSSFVLLPVLSLQIAFALPAGQHTALLSELDTFSEAVFPNLCPPFFVQNSKDLGLKLLWALIYCNQQILWP